MEDCNDTRRVNLVSVRTCVSHEIWAAILAAKNFKISSDRTGLTRSAVFSIFLIVLLPVGNHHVFKGPDDLKGYGYFYVRLYWTGVGFQANIVEEDVLLSAMLHIFVGLKRTCVYWFIADTEQHYLRPPPTLINWWRHDGPRSTCQRHLSDRIQGLAKTEDGVFQRSISAVSSCTAPSPLTRCARSGS